VYRTFHDTQDEGGRFTERLCPFCGLPGARLDVMAVPPAGQRLVAVVHCYRCNMLVYPGAVEFAMLPFGALLRRLEE